MICKKVSGHVEKALEIITPGVNGTPYSFLIAFDKHTPLNYHLKHQGYTNGVHTLTYESVSSLGKITKQYNVYDSNYTIDMVVTIAPHAPLVPRIIFPAPQLAGVEKNATYDLALINNQKIHYSALKFQKSAIKHLQCQHYQDVQTVILLMPL